MNQPQSFCTTCGAPLASAFCTSCGQRAALPPTPPEAATLRRRPARPPMPQPALPDATVVLPAHSLPTYPIPPAGATYPTSDQPPVDPRPTGSGRKALVQGLIAFVTVVALGLGAVFGYGWWRDRPVSQALGSAGDAVDSVLEPLGAATDLADVSAAGEAAPKAAATVTKALAGLESEDGDLAARARDVLTDELALLEALAPLASLSDTSLTVWGSALPEIESAESGVLASRRALAAVDAGAADAVDEPGKAIRTAIEVVGTAADSSMTAELADLLNDLGQARTTSAVAALGERAEPAAAAVAAAATGQTGAPAERLGDLRDSLGALADLADMSPENLGVWSDAQSVLSASTTSLDIDARATLEATTGWVDDAQVTMAAWQEAYALAEDDRSHRTSGLDGYVRRMTTLLREYDRARDAIDDDLNAAELDDYSASYDVEYAMEEGVLTRQDISNRLSEITAPVGMGAAHNAIIAVVDNAVDAMLAGEQAVEDYNACYEDCGDTFRDTAAWQDFSDRSSGIGTQYGAALETWDNAYEAALRAAGALPLPPMPEV